MLYFDDDDGEGHEKDNAHLAAIDKLIITQQPIHHKARRRLNIEPTDDIRVLIFLLCYIIDWFVSLPLYDSIYVVVAIELKKISDAPLRVELVERSTRKFQLA